MPALGALFPWSLLLQITYPASFRLFFLRVRSVGEFCLHCPAYPNCMSKPAHPMGRRSFRSRSMRAQLLDHLRMWKAALLTHWPNHLSRMKRKGPIIRPFSTRSCIASEFLPQPKCKVRLRRKCAAHLWNQLLTPKIQNLESGSLWFTKSKALKSNRRLPRLRSFSFVVTPFKQLGGFDRHDFRFSNYCHTNKSRFYSKHLCSYSHINCTWPLNRKYAKLKWLQFCTFPWSSLVMVNVAASF